MEGIAIPRTTKAWTVEGFTGFDCLKYGEQQIPVLSDSEVLVKIQGASINYRDIMFPQGTYPFAHKSPVIPGSDGAGTVISTGQSVSRFTPGDKVITVLHQKHIAGPMNASIPKSGLGANIDGTFREYGAFDEQGLVKMPENLTFTQAATLSCTGVTAWNALFGLLGKQLSPGQWVLTQGTGGVSIFAIQFAKAAGAKVIATTSSDERAKILRDLGADHIINYKCTPDWGSIARELTGGVGVDIVVDVAGPTTLKQSALSVKQDGIINTVGLVGGEAKAGDEMPSLLDTWLNLYMARGVWVGSRTQMEDMCRAVEASGEKLRPVVDSRVFRLEELREAYEYLVAGGHQGKVCIEL